MEKIGLLLIGTLMLITAGCNDNPQKITINKERYGQLSDGQNIDLYTFTTDKGIKVEITNYGATIVSIKTPDKTGALGEVTLGFDSLKEYEKNRAFFGATIGRFANRIAKGTFLVDDAAIQVSINNGENHLHGGINGFDRVVWDAEIIKNDDDIPALKLSYNSVDGEEGYPGNLKVEVIYTVTKEQVLINYYATTDRKTPINLTNHSYYNLAGEGDILSHQLEIASKSYTPLDENQIPTGEIISVKNTPFDFRKPKTIGDRIDETGNGYDHNFVIETTDDSYVAKLHDPKSGRFLEIYSDQPGLQFYTGNFLNDSLSKGGRTFGRYSGLCLETQHFPDSPNQPHFPSTWLNPGEVFESYTLLHFGVK